MTKKPCVFVVEDDDSIRKLLEVALSAKDYRVLCFENAVDALAEMSATLPDAVVMDIMMEGMDGITALKLMRDNARLRRLGQTLREVNRLDVERLGPVKTQGLHALALLRQGRGAHQALTAPPHTRRQPEPARSGKHQILAADVFGRQRGSGEKHAGDVLRLVAGDAALDMNQHKCSLFCIQTNIR